ncbi:S-layer homology domain-containing protein [Brevibacillus laterosporus]|uniref:S-layer homology domain-containing protein n=1 Tax=Brevibacillus laterosporus TaxID=1465 RepID=UPI00215C589D|nr:S-layer homology domain-containing protein [Brevibacillus laterosporus]MCR8994768.1 S-layer homology domain-containing protein [Brevibacillus laterosporus]
MKRISALLLSFLLLFSMMPLLAQAKNTNFWDVSRDHWAYEAITDMATKGIIDGYSDGSFRPNSKVTRAEFAKIMIAAAGVQLGDKWGISQTFKDVPRSHWAFTYVEYAKPYLTGYKSGSTYSYKPDQNAVREDIAVALVRLLGYDQSKSAKVSLLNQFRDKERISYNLRTFIAIALDNDLIKGFNDGTFRPQDAITRAEAASLLYRAKLDEQKVVFPTDPTSPVPQPKPDQKTREVVDDFSDNQLKKWNSARGTGAWVVYDKRVTAYSNDSALKHYLLPLKDKVSRDDTEWEISVDIIPVKTDAEAGIFINGNDGEADIVYLTKDSLQIRHLPDPEKKETKAIASIATKLTTNNSLKIKASGDTLSVYLNDTNIYTLQNVKWDHSEIGLYMSKDAFKQIPSKTTWFDNFTFTATKK